MGSAFTCFGTAIADELKRKVRGSAIRPLQNQRNLHGLVFNVQLLCVQCVRDEGEPRILDSTQSVLTPNNDSEKENIPHHALSGHVLWIEKVVLA